jgi:mono/diheme cytochrome c family protein
MTKWMWMVGIPTLMASCVTDDPTVGKVSSEAQVFARLTNVAEEGILPFGGVMFAENPTTLLEAGDNHVFDFDGRAGGIVTITSQGTGCGAPDTLLTLFSPEDAFGNRRNLAENDDGFLSNCFLDAQIRQFRLPQTGSYKILSTSFLTQGGGHYRLTLACNNNACVDPAAQSFAGTRILQADIDRGAFSVDTLHEIGDFLFAFNYQVNQGLGNALPGLPANNTPRPNYRQIPNNVHFAAFGGPEAQSCLSCHNIGGDDGGGDNNHNIFQIGDGINRNTGVPRQGIALLGLGLREKAAQEMTAELKVLLDAGKAQAAQTKVNVSVALRPPTNAGINFGTVIARPDGTVDFTGLVRIDTDLIVRPFGWKGREATVRRFIEGGWRVHFGMQTEPSVNNHEKTPNVNTFGNGPVLQDPDADGVQKEISDGQLSAGTVYMNTLEMPVRVPAATAAAQARVDAGEVLFTNICAGCHKRDIVIKSPLLVLKGDTTTGAGVTINLATDMKEPRPAQAANGSITFEVWSDFRRFQMGTTLADVKNFNQIPADTFVTPPLWGIADSAPYLHDGRAPDLREATIQHGEGNDAGSIAAFLALPADDQLKIIEFMESLGRVEDL